VLETSILNLFALRDTILNALMSAVTGIETTAAPAKLTLANMLAICRLTAGFPDCSTCSASVASSPSVRVKRVPVSAKVILTPCDEVKVTHLGEDGGFLEAADVDPGASSGDTSNGPTGRRDQGDREAGGMLA
jgi:hypothetical protein